MSTAKKLARPLVGVAISLVAIVLLMRVIDRNALATALTQADFRFIPLAIGLYFVSAWMRAIRFRRLLGIGSESDGLGFQVFIIGLTVNNLLPFRLGEVARTYLANQWMGVAVGESVAALIVERILDGIALALFLAFAVSLAPSAPAYLLGFATVFIAGFGACFVVLLLASWRQSLVLELVRFAIRPLPAKLAAKVMDLSESFLRGVSHIRGPRPLAIVGGQSIAAWAVELGVFAAVMPAFHIQPTLVTALVTGASGTFATLVPSSPGYVGTFHGAVIKVLTDLAGTSLADATAYAIVVHATLFIPVVVAGMIIAWRRNISLQQVTHRPAGVGSMPLQRPLVSSK